jgi:hypothetical protein
MKNLLNRKLFELFELFDKKVKNYSLFDKFLNPYLNPSLDVTKDNGVTEESNGTTDNDDNNKNSIGTNEVGDLINDLVNDLIEDLTEDASNNEATTAQNESVANISRQEKLFKTLESLKYFSQQVQCQLDQSGFSPSLQHDGSFLTSTHYGEDTQNPQISPETGPKSPESPMGSSKASKFTPDSAGMKSLVPLFPRLTKKKKIN